MNNELTLLILWNYSHSTTSGESRRSCRIALMLAEGRQSRKTLQKNHGEAVIEAVVSFL